MRRNRRSTIVKEATPPPRNRVAPLLTSRQREIAAAVAEGLTNTQIARRLGLAEDTVANHVRQAMLQLGVPNRTMVALWAAQQRAEQKTEAP
jgi:DNA-binding NarL/FixJ family response regulator